MIGLEHEEEPVIWSLDVVQRLMGLSVRREVALDSLLMAQYPKTILEIEARAVVTALREAAQTVAADLRERDIRVEEYDRAIGDEDEGDALQQTLTVVKQIRAWWFPTTTDVRLLGGPEDGKVYALPKSLRPIDFVLPMPEDLLPRPGEEGWPTVGTYTVTYCLWGWNNTDGVWIYAAKGFSL